MLRACLHAVQVDPNEFFCHPVPLGDNLYSKDRPKVVPPPRAADAGMQDKKEQPEQAAQEPVARSDSHGGRVSILMDEWCGMAKLLL